MSRAFQITVAFDIPNDMRNNMRGLHSKVRTHIIRQSIRSALLPARNSLKAKLMSLSLRSRQSSGASMRSLTTKYGISKNNPDRFYGIIGVNRKYIEATVQGPSSFRNAIQRQVSFGIKTKRRNDDGSPIFSRRFPRQEVRSRLRRRVSGTRKRWPSKYWHLVEFGFNAVDRKGPWKGKRHRKFTGHNFVREATADSASTCVAIFESRIRELFQRMFR